MISRSVPKLGAIVDDDHCLFCVWAPRARAVTLRIVEPSEREVPLSAIGGGYHSARVKGVTPGTLYYYRLDGGADRPDPASRSQPRGVHGPSEVVDTAFAWTDDEFEASPLEHAVFYELHVGTFSEAGTFDGAIERLDALRELGITHVELMPISVFPGSRNWGYDGVSPYAVHNDYGGVAGLQRFVDACHTRGLAVALDVVYNHMGPEGNYLGEFGPYFIDRYKTPWGAALNFDGPHSDDVRRFFIESAVFFADECHMDAFRLDAIHAILDTSALPFLREVTDAIHAAGTARSRSIAVIGETDANDVRVVEPAERGGLGMDAQWADDFHHAVHAFVTKERAGYYLDFGSLESLARAFSSAYVFEGQYSEFRKRRHGSNCDSIPGDRFVVCTQNHDQIGNRARGDRLSQSLTFDQQKVLAALLLLSPYVPLLFMGQEYGDEAPFLYFTSHGDPGLVEAVRKGRRREFASFGWKKDDIPDPQDEATFRRSKLRWADRDSAEGSALFGLHRRLLQMRREVLPLSRLSPKDTHAEIIGDGAGLAVRRRADAESVLALFSFSTPIPLPPPRDSGPATKILDTLDPAFGGPPDSDSDSDAAATWRCVVYALRP